MRGANGIVPDKQLFLLAVFGFPFFLVVFSPPSRSFSLFFLLSSSTN